MWAGEARSSVLPGGRAKHEFALHQGIVSPGDSAGMKVRGFVGWGWCPGTPGLQLRTQPALHEGLCSLVPCQRIGRLAHALE